MVKSQDFFTANSPTNTGPIKKIQKFWNQNDEISVLMNFHGFC